MRTEKYLLKYLAIFFKRNKIATINQLQNALGNPKERTVFRKLKTLDYISSYSHRGMYYTLQSVARFDSDGLWTHKAVWFSCYGNLLETAKAFINHCEAGYSASELRDILHVETKHCLLRLARTGKVQRKKIEGCYIYFCTENNTFNSQQKARRQRVKKPLSTMLVANPNLAEQEAKAAILLFLSTLDERQRRLYAGLESLKLGYGGDKHIASVLGMNPHTVAKGRKEIISAELSHDRIRVKGGGRLEQEKKRPKS